MFFNSDLIHLQHYSPRLLVKPVCPGLPPRPLTQQLWSRPRVCLLKDSRVLCVHLKLQQLRQPVAGETGRAVKWGMSLLCGEDAIAGNLCRWDHPPVEKVTPWFSHNILLPGLLSAPALPQPLKWAENLAAVLFLEPVQSNPLLNTESMWLLMRQQPSFQGSVPSVMYEWRAC